MLSRNRSAASWHPFALITACAVLVCGGAFAIACTSPAITPPEIEIEIEPEFESYDSVLNRVIYKIEVEVGVASPAQQTQCQCGLGLGTAGATAPASFSVLSVAVRNRFTSNSDLDYDLPAFAGFAASNAVTNSIKSLGNFNTGATASGFAATVNPFVPPVDTADQKLLLSFRVSFAPEDFNAVNGNVMQFAAGSNDPTHSLGILNNYKSQLILPPFQLSTCDFNFDQVCDIADLNALLAIGPIKAGVSSTDQTQVFDLDGDDVINNQDVDEWLSAAANDEGAADAYKRGDADLNGQIDFNDFLAWLLHFRQQTLLWNEGDFDGSGVVDFTDLIILVINLNS